MKKKRLLKLSAILIIAVLIITVKFIDESYRVPVLMYHSINSNINNSRLIVEEDTFKKQMQYLKDHGFKILSLDEYIELKKKKEKPKKKSVVITFDDGFKDNYTAAYPVLKKMNFPATIFVVTGWVGKDAMLNWQQIKELESGPLIDIGSHSLSHDMLTQLPKAAAINEIKSSKHILEEKLNKDIDIFAYPTGDHSEFIKEITRLAGYKAACATSVDKRTSYDDLFAIRRIRISQSADNLLVFGAQVSGYYTFFKDRRVKEGKWKKY